MTEERSVNILDLDQFVPEDKEIIIDKKAYAVRGNASVRMTLELMRSAEAWQKKPNSAEAVEQLFESIKLFFKTPIEKEIFDNISVDQLPKLLAFLYGKKNPEPGDNEKNEQSQSAK